MAFDSSEAKDYLDQATRCRALAKQSKRPEAKAQLAKIALEFERLAATQYRQWAVLAVTEKDRRHRLRLAERIEAKAHSPGSGRSLV
ncbi:MAG TPA: hypothetical protein VLV50_06030 [Stellaceae bacterium]|nr:hypothetical protein [Stellaceae bacterium]